MPDLTPNLSIAVALPRSDAVDLDLAVAQALTLTTGVDIHVTDAPAVVIEPDRGKARALVEVTDFVATVSTNSLKSPTTDFESLGVQGGDVVEVGGLNAGSYVIAGVQGSTLIVGAKLFNSESGVTGEVRVRQTAVAYAEAATVTTPAFFNAGFSLGAGLNMLIVT